MQDTAIEACKEKMCIVEQSLALRDMAVTELTAKVQALEEELMVVLEGKQKLFAEIDREKRRSHAEQEKARYQREQDKKCWEQKAARERAHAQEALVKVRFDAEQSCTRFESRFTFFFDVCIHSTDVFLFFFS